MAQPLFSIKRKLTSPIPPILCLESVKIVWNCSDGKSGRLKLKKSTLKLGKRVCATIFVSDCRYLVFFGPEKYVVCSSISYKSKKLLHVCFLLIIQKSKLIHLIPSRKKMTLHVIVL